MGGHYDEEMGITSSTDYYPCIEGVELNFKDSCCHGAIFSVCLSGERNLLYAMIDCPKILHWTPSVPQFLFSQGGVEIEYLEDGNMCREMLVTWEEADERASRVVCDTCYLVHIEVTRALSVGTSTVWLKVERFQYYSSIICLDVCLVVEFGNSEECTRFLHEHMRELKLRDIFDVNTDVAAIGDIMCALVPIAEDLLTAQTNAAARCLPYSQFVDDLPQPETQLIRHQRSDQGDDRPCYLTLHISISISSIANVDWSATTIPPTFPLCSDAFRSLNSLHLKFPSPASHDRNPNSSSQSHRDDLTITISAGEISFSTSRNSISLGNGFTLSSVHRTVNINYINAIKGDAFLAPISGGTIGGRNNVNNSFSMRTDEGVNMLNDLRSINDLANGSSANSPLTTGSTDLQSGQLMIGTKPARKTISTYARRFATAIRFRPPRTTERHNG